MSCTKDTKKSEQQIYGRRSRPHKLWIEGMRTAVCSFGVYRFGGVGGECIHLFHSFSCFELTISGNSSVLYTHTHGTIAGDVCKLQPNDGMAQTGRRREAERERVGNKRTNNRISHSIQANTQFSLSSRFVRQGKRTHRSAVHFSSIYSHVSLLTVCSEAKVNHVCVCVCTLQLLSFFW